MISILICYFTLIITLWLAGGIFGGILWPYTLNKILKYQRRRPKVKFKNGFYIGLVPAFGYLCIPAALITYIIMLFIPKKERK